MTLRIMRSQLVFREALKPMAENASGPEALSAAYSHPIQLGVATGQVGSDSIWVEHYE